MKLSAYIEERARRHFSLCVAINFIKGRSSQRVAAACLYISCRESKTSHMLIDFSDKLRVSFKPFVGCKPIMIIHPFRFR